MTSGTTPIAWGDWRVGMLLVTLSLGLSGCTVVHNQTVEFVSAPLVEHQYLGSVALVLEESFSAFEYRRENFEQLIVYPLGGYLRRCAESIAERSFTRIETFTSTGSAVTAEGIDAILRPRVARVDVRGRGFGWEKRHTLVALEWLMRDKSNQKTVWLATIEGTAEGDIGSAFTIHRRDRQAMQEAVDDACRRSAQALGQSVEVARFLQSVRGR